MGRSVSKIYFIFVLLVLSLSFVSAGFFSDFFDGITGRVVGETTCTDSDVTDEFPSGKNLFTKGTTIGDKFGPPDENIEIVTRIDYCSLEISPIQLSDCTGSGCGVYEWTCVARNTDYSFVSGNWHYCSGGCDNGVCIDICGDCGDNEICMDGECTEISETCTDSDDGLDYYNGGTTRGRIDIDDNEIMSFTDSCWLGPNGVSECSGDDCHLNEYYCDNKDPSKPFVKGTGSYYCSLGCKDGACIKTESYKNLSMYSDKEVFLISDKNWRDVLSFVPVSIWTNDSGGINKHPFLIYHEDEYSYTTHDRLLETGMVWNGDYYIDGDLILYSSVGGIYIYNISSGGRKNIDINTDINFMKLSNNKIAWKDVNWDLGTYDLYLYDITTGTNNKILIGESLESGDSFFSGNNIVWSESVGSIDIGGAWSREVRDVYLYDISTQVKIKLAENIDGGNSFAVSDNYIILSERIDDLYHLKLYNISTHQAIVIEMLDSPQDLSISGDRIVWWDQRNDNADVYLYDISTQQETQVTADLGNDRWAKIFGNKIVWEREDNIYMYDIEIKEEITIADSIFKENRIKISEDNIVFCINDCEEGISIYNSTINDIQEFNNFDADSIIYFMQQYSSDKVTIIGETPQELDDLLVMQQQLGAGLAEEEIRRIPPNTYLSYWESFNTIVYVEDDYQLALLASTYASLINVPLVIENSEIDNFQIFENKNVVCIGDVLPIGKNCSVNYNLEQLQQKYVDETNTNKIILVNSDDLEISSENEYVPDKSQAIYNLYTKDSLASPLLASAKHELLLSVESTDYHEVDNILTSKLNKYFNIPTDSTEKLPYYLTIIASPDAIPMSRSATDEDGCYCGEWSCVSDIEVDGRVYGSLNNYELINFPVGRIMGVSISDVSGYIARDLFFDELPKNKDALLVVREDWQNEIGDICWELDATDCHYNEQVLEEYAREYFWTDEVRNQFDQEFFYSGHDEVGFKQNEIYERYDDVYLNLFVDHGYPSGFEGMMSSSYMMDNKIYLNPSIVLDLACLTCKYSGQGDLFCAQGIRRGALVQQGAVEVSYWHQEFDNILIGTILDGKTIGEAYLEARNEDYEIDHYNFCTGIRGDPFYALLGDPTFKPRYWD